MKPLHGGQTKSFNWRIINSLQQLQKVLIEPKIGMRLALAQGHVLPVSDDFKLARGSQ
jgi:hypothetical protein